ncbi:MAG TPA: hypothetical protein VLF62_06105 [Candidatus Saccharimonadales bacterium]|nr:hypothetical protein [Candidatus Saccharimonadales bacterium]
MTSAEPVRHTRPAPEEWAALATRAQEIVPQASHAAPLTARETRSLWKTVVKLPAERREANLYYGMGQIICEIAQALHAEPARSELVHNAAALLVAHATIARQVPRDRPFRPVAADIIGRRLSPAILPTAVRAQQKLPPWHRALTGVLAVSRTQEQPFLPARWYTKHHVMKQVRYEYPLAHNIANNAFTGASNVFFTLVTGKTPGDPVTEKIAMTPIEPADIARARQSSAFSGAAQLRLDEFHNGRGWKTENGQPEFDRAYLQTEPPEIIPEHGKITVGHTGRFICPAVQAGGFAIELARSLLPEIILASREIVPGQLLQTC